MSEPRWYPRVPGGDNDVYMHRQRAERALGHPLPLGAEVHHHDESFRPDSPLVICQNRAYHKALHVRMRIRAAGGDPWLDKLCGSCKTPKRREEFNKSKFEGDGIDHRCRACLKSYRDGRKEAVR